MAKVQIDSLTSLRGIAAWWVVIFHFRDLLWAPGSTGYAVSSLGYLAVDLFFIMSGFVIQMSYGDWFKREFSWEVFKRFMVFRLARIYPLHLFMSVVFLINPLMIHLYSQSGFIGDRYDPLQYLFSLFLIHSWGFLGWHGWNVPSWSISVEFAAYIIFPIFTFYILRRLANYWAMAATAFLCLLFLSLIFLAFGKSSLGEGIADIGIFRCIFEFCFGALLYQLHSRLLADDLHRIAGYASGVLALLLIVITLATGCADYYLVPLAFGAIVVFLSGDRTAIHRLLESRWLYRLGEVSYSTYLCHFFVKDWIKFAFVRGPDTIVPSALIYGALVLGLSFVLYRFVELPGRRAFRSVLDIPSAESVGVAR